MHRISPKRTWVTLAALTMLVSLPAWASAPAWAAYNEAPAQQSSNKAGKAGEAEPQATSVTTRGKSKAQADGCAPAWEQVEGTDVSGEFSNFSNIEVLSPDDIWAVGSERPSPRISASDTLVEHWDGSKWTRLPTPTLMGLWNNVRDIDAVAANDIWAVGSAYDGVNEDFSLLLHWNGASWTNVPAPEELQGYVTPVAVEAIAADDVWAVGSVGETPSTAQAFALHWNGNTWSNVPLPQLGDDIGRSSLEDLVAFAPNDIWAIGSQVPEFTFADDGKPLFLHWDGKMWNVMPTDGLDIENTPSTFRGAYIAAMSGTGPDDLWAVGFASEYSLSVHVTFHDFTPSIFIAHWDGHTWSQMPGPTIDATSAGLYDVKALAPDDVWAVGSTTQGCCYYRTLVLHWDGSSWSVVPSFSEGSGGRLLGIDALPDGDLWAAGTYSADNRMQALVERYTGECPEPEPPPTCSITFSDVPPNDTFYNSVRCIACQNIANGYADGTFRPEQTITRGQMSKMVSNAAGFSDPIEAPFNDYRIWADIPVTDTFYIHTGRLAIHDIVDGYACSPEQQDGECSRYGPRYFRPAGNVTRGQAARFIAKSAFLDEVVPPGQQTFSDVRPGQLFWSEIERMAAHGGIGGYPCGTRPDEPCDSQQRPYYRPGEHVTRGQVSKFIGNIFYPDCLAQQEGP
ncbi:MAG: S-layer homology domain-containing protein [Chloroflexota bacterium]|nr:S-layer homology domain-containing protein [Chloroflexota bacterium]MDQ5864755.1 S-layer homology domain-containing protein [Chloroflexota bacterium]